MDEYDDRVPIALKETQEWFASIITRPIDDNSQMNPRSPSGIPMTVEAQKYIIPSPTLTPDKRIQLYNQQYWWRLLSILHDNFPLTTRVFGYYDFNKMIGVPYLEKYPPKHWSLNHLGDLLPKWVREEYHEKDKALIQEAIDTDWAYVNGFFAGEYPFEKGNENDILNKTLSLQPHLSLHSITHRLLPFRDVMIEREPEYWKNNKFPHLESSTHYFFVIYRNKQYNLAWSEIDEPQFLLLSQFRRGLSISEACKWLEKQQQSIQSAANRQLHVWFQEWTVHRWLGKSN
jgi:Putative DNA-binding domain